MSGLQILENTVINVRAADGHVSIRATRGGLETLRLMIDSTLRGGDPSTITHKQTGVESLRVELDETMRDE